MMKITILAWTQEQWYDYCLEKHLENCAYEAAENLLDDDNLPLDPNKYSAEERAIINEVTAAMSLGEIWRKAC